MMTLHRLFTLILVVLFTGIGLIGNSQSIDPLLSQPTYSFIENKGQVTDQRHKPNPAAKFILPLPNNNVVLKANGFSYDAYVTEVKERLQQQVVNGIPFDKQGPVRKDVTYKYHRIDVEFEGGNPRARIIPEGKSADYVTYYLASGQEVKVHHYSKITYKEVYPGIDVEFLARPGTDKPIEYNFIVHPGADMDLIKLRYKGANSNKLVNDKLELTLAHGKLTESIPASYWQKTKDPEDIRYKQISTKQNEITLGFASANKARVKNRSEVLVIDPTPYLEWGTYYGGGVGEEGYSIARDASGNIVVAGSTNSSGSIATAGAQQETFAGVNDAFLVKFNSSNVRQWCTYYGGTGNDIGYSVAIDGSGNIIITGSTASATAIATTGQIVLGGPGDAFIVKFNSSGAREWGTYYGGTGGEAGFSVAVDGSGNIIVTGETNSATSIATTGQTVYGTGGDAFIVKFNASGVLQWGTYYGGSGSDTGKGVTTDGSGNILVAGSTGSTGAIATTGQTTYGGGGSDAFVAKFNSSGIRQWGTYHGGSGAEQARAIENHVSGGIFIAGTKPSPSSSVNVLAAKFTSSGSLQWSTVVEASTLEYGSDIAVGADGISYVVGFKLSTGSGGDFVHCFVRKFDVNGVLQSTFYHGGSASFDFTWGNSIAIDASSYIYLTGTTGNSSLIATPGAHQTVLLGGQDAFIAKFNPCFTDATASELACDICATGSRCIGGGTTEFASTITNGLPVWSISDNNPAVSNAISQTGVVTWDPAFTGIATITLTVTGCGPQVIKTKEVTVNPLATATDIACDICVAGSRCVAGGTTTFSSTVTNGTATWSISDDNPEVSNAIGTSTGIVTWNSGFTGEATITLTVTGCGSPTVPPKVITIIPNVSASNLDCDTCEAPTPARCEGAGTTQFTSDIEDATTIVWTIPDDNPSVSNAISSEGLVTWNSSFAGLATVTLTASGCGPTVIKTKPILVKTTYNTPGLTINGPSFVCPGTEVEFSVTVANGPPSPQIEFLINDELVEAGTETEWVIDEWNYENASTVRVRIPNPNECLAVQGPHAEVMDVYTQLQGVVDIIPDGGNARCKGPGTTQFTPSSNLTDYLWGMEYIDAGTSITQSGLVTWDPNETGTPLISIAAQDCPTVKASIFYSVEAPPDAPPNQTVIGCNWERITLRAHSPGNTIKWYDDEDVLVHTGDVFEAGTFPVATTYNYFVESVTPLGCISETRGNVQLQITPFCDDNKLNWIETKALNANLDIYGHAKQYFDFTGKSLQSQSKLFSAPGGVKIVASQALRDRLGREVSTTLVAPLQLTDFNFFYGFVLNGSSAPYNFSNFDGAKLLNPDPVDNTVPGTLGWYYSSNNTMEDHVPTTGYPYSRIEFYEDGTDEVKRSASAGNQHRLGNNHEVLSGTFPVFTELDDYLTRRLTAIPGITHDGSLLNEAIQSVARDENGKYSISISDKSGKQVMSCRAGTSTDNVLTITNLITSSGNEASPNYRSMTYFYLLHDQPVTISGSSDFVAESFVTNVRKAPGQTFAGGDGKWPAGFYRILLTNTSSEVTIGYTNYFLDVSYQFYDDAGRLKSSVSPNGYKSWKDGIAYSLIDKTSYVYNHQGWLLSLTEPDAGLTTYMYRKDGKIRFSQNALQKENEVAANGKGKFSYTQYDRLGRPIESGQYIGTATAFNTLTSQLEYNQQVAFTTPNRNDWTKTHYDYADPSMPALPTGYSVDFVRGAVAWSENVNIKTWYSYDELGRVNWMAQKPSALDRIFLTRYTYDDLGNVVTVMNASSVSGNPVFPFYHHYEYDADKRLSKVYTSTDGSSTKLRASYEYYLHGPLKRIELGDQIQGIDFVYNIQGWLTQINHPDKLQDPGGDTNDVFGMILDYYETALTDLFQTSMTTGALDPNQYHRLMDPGKILENSMIGYGSQLALRIGESDWRHSIKKAMEKNASKNKDDHSGSIQRTN